jgi:hypothetical protein
VGKGNGDPEVSELPSVQGYSWDTLPPGDINSETWSSRLGVGRGANNPTPEKNIKKPQAMPVGRKEQMAGHFKSGQRQWYHRRRNNFRYGPMRGCEISSSRGSECED